ncbi:MAG: hypothetical protein ACTSP4_09515 [Candidatus Hodarchaeales archaeon]
MKPEISLEKSLENKVYQKNIYLLFSAIFAFLCLSGSAMLSIRLIFKKKEIGISSYQLNIDPTGIVISGFLLVIVFSTFYWLINFFLSLDNVNDYLVDTSRLLGYEISGKGRRHVIFSRDGRQMKVRISFFKPHLQLHLISEEPEEVIECSLAEYQSRLMFLEVLELDLR